MEKERLEFLLNRYFDQVLSIEEKQELERVLLESVEAREEFWRLAAWHGAMRQWGEEEWGRRDKVEAPFKTPLSPRIHVLRSQKRAAATLQTRSKSVRQSSVTASPWWPIAAVAAVVLGFFGLMQWNSMDRVRTTNEHGIALLTHVSSAVWADKNAAPKSGETLRGGTLRLKSGALQIQFSRGARVVLEGPAEFELLSKNSGALHHGKLVATVPETAHGFSVRTHSFSVIDHGTQFGCIVPLSAAPEVHVFQGAVGLTTSANMTRELSENQAVRLAGAQLQEIRPNLSAFLTEEKLSRLESSLRRVKNWRQSSRAFSRHQGMLVHFDFEEDSRDGMARTLVNRAPNALPETNGIIEGCEWTEGRWPGKSALKFSDSNARVQLSLPGEYRSVSFVAYLRANGTPFHRNSLIRSDADANLGEVHWFISGEGALGWSARIAPRGRGNQLQHIFSPPVIREETLGSWHMVAAVFDGTTVTHYIDGKVVGSGPARLLSPIRLEKLEVGNGSPVLQPRTEREAAVNFFGCIDELAILSAALTAEEIRRLYEQGRP